MEKIRTWYNENGKYDSDSFVNYTEGSKLAKECQKIINKQQVSKSKKANVKIAVKSAVTILRLTVKCEKLHMKSNVKDPIIEKKITYGGETYKSIAERFDQNLDEII